LHFNCFKTIFSPIFVIRVIKQGCIITQYRHVRRYGVNASSFLLEGGRQAAPGNGLFIFKNCKGHLIREIMEAKMRAFSQPDDDEYSYAAIERPSPAVITTDTSIQRIGQVGNNAKNLNGDASKASDANAAAQYYQFNDAAAAKSGICDSLEEEEPRCPSLPSVHSNKSSGFSDAKSPKISKIQPKVKNKTTAQKPLVAEKPSKVKPVVNDKAKKKKNDKNVTSGSDVIKSKSDYCEFDEIDTVPKPAAHTPRMSEVLRQLANQNLRPTADEEDDPYGYSQLDIKQEGRRERSEQAEADGNLYGQKLVLQIRKEEESPYEELSVMK